MDAGCTSHEACRFGFSGGLEATAAGIPNSSLSFTWSLQLTWVLWVNYLPQLRDPSAVSKDVHELLLSIRLSDGRRERIWTTGTRLLDLLSSVVCQLWRTCITLSSLFYWLQGGENFSLIPRELISRAKITTSFFPLEASAWFPSPTAHNSAPHPASPVIDTLFLEIFHTLYGVQQCKSKQQFSEKMC